MSKIVDSLSKLGDVILFGGTFDPIQNAHTKIAEIALKECKFQAVVFVPSKQNPLKNHTPMASDKDRLAMLTIALKGKQGMYIWPFEINSEQTPSYTADTVLKARQQTGTSKLGFLSGSDVIGELSRWKDPQKILSLLDQWIVANRDDDRSDLEKSLANIFRKEEVDKFYWLSNTATLVSSSEIRKNMYSDALAKDAVPEKVLDYIKDKNIYR